MNKEPTEELIKQLMESSGFSYFNAREKLRDIEYKDTYNKPAGMDWGTFWKMY